MAQSIKRLSCKHKDPGSILRILTKPSVHREGRERQAWGSLDKPNSHWQAASLALIGGQPAYPTVMGCGVGDLILRNDTRSCSLPSTGTCKHMLSHTKGKCIELKAMQMALIQ